MSEHLRALLYLMIVALPTFALLRRALTPAIIDPIDFDRRRRLWLGLTVVVFLTGSMWALFAAMVVALLSVKKKERNPLALFTAMLYLVPNGAVFLSGIGPINQLISLTPVRLVSIVVLLPAALVLRRDPASPRLGYGPADKAMVAYIVLQAVLQVALDSFTSTSRTVIYQLTDILLPYYVASRSLRSVRQFNEVLATFLITSTVMAAIGVFEFFKHWLLYDSLAGLLGTGQGFGAYVGRGGNLRAVAAAGHSIVLGYAIAISLAFYAHLRNDIPQRYRRWVLFLLVSGLMATLSRGPWVGAAVVGGVVLALSPGKRSDTFKGALGLAAVLGVLAVTPVGKQLLALLPFFGSAEAETIDYRQRLFQVSMKVIAQNPFFGSFFFRGDPLMQELVQGEGIIDIVNVYIGIALTFGLVGLTLFVTPFINAGVNILNSLRINAGDGDLRRRSLGIALLAALASIALMLMTLSNIWTVPTAYCIVIGSCLAYSRLARHSAATNVPTTAAPYGGPPRWNAAALPSRRR